MTKPPLTVQRLLEAGFREVGCWELNDRRDLNHRIDLPDNAGVYAFAIDGNVRYVGLASKSVRQRLGFYCKPGVSQRTNIRLNEIIRGHIEEGAIVQILIGHPPDGSWKGLHISGAEGLEAGLIRDFDLPWNRRGSEKASLESNTLKVDSPSRGGKGRVSQRILEVVKKRPGLTELEIAEAIYGPGAVQQRVNQDCRLLVSRGLLERRGNGGRSDPYNYF